MLTLRWVRCRNFKGIADVEARLPSKGAFLVEGPNEAGKTSLFDAVRYALTGLSPQSKSPQNLIAYGQSDAYVGLEGLAPGVRFVVEREISRSGLTSIRMSLEEGLGPSERSTEAEVAEALGRLTGLSREGLYAASFIEFDRPGGFSESLVDGPGFGLVVPRRTELEAAAGELLEQSELRRLLDDARQNAVLAELAERLAFLQKERNEAERGLALARLRMAYSEYEPKRAGFASVQAEYAALESTRLGLRRRLEAVERRSATQALVDSIRASSNAARELRSRTEAIELECDAASSSKDQATKLINRTAKMREAANRLAGARERDSEAMELRARLGRAEGKAAEIEALKGGGANAGDSRERSRGVEPDNTMLPAHSADRTTMRMGAVALALAGGGILLFLLAPRHSAAIVVISLALVVAGVAALAYGAHALARRGSGASPSAGEVDGQIGDYPAAQRAWPGGQTIGIETAHADLYGLRESFARAVREAEFAHSEAAKLMRELGMEGGGMPTGAAIREAEEAARRLEEQASVLERRERELQPLQAQAERIRQDEKQRLDRLREMWPDFAWRSDPTPEELEAIVELAAALPPPSSAISLGRDLAQVSARLAALDPTMDETALAQQAAWDRLIEMARPCGISLDPKSVEAGLAAVAPDLVTPPEDYEKQAAQKLEVLDAEIQSVESQLGSLEASLGRNRLEVDLPAAKAEVERLERQMEVRRQAVVIAAKAQDELGRQADSQALRTARALLPAFTGQRYFDLRLGPDEEIELWDEEASTWTPARQASAGLLRQIYLATRLGAARGAIASAAPCSPAFLFLDDPGSGADLPRRRRIATELATGALRDWFRQVLVFAVEGQMDRRQFDFVASMEEGRMSALGLDEMAKSAMGV